MVIRYKNQLRYQNYKFGINKRFVSALQYNFLISKNIPLIKMMKQRHSATIAVTTISHLYKHTWTPVSLSSLASHNATAGSTGNGMFQLL